MTASRDDVGPDRRAGHEPQARAGGFTLIEIMVVVAIIAIVGQMVLSNIGALVPGTILDAESQKIMSELEYLRSEAQLQGKVFKFEIDLDENRYRRILPAEMRVSIEQDEADLAEAQLSWIPIDGRCDIAGYEIAGSSTRRDGRAVLIIDQNGFTADQALFIRMKSEDLKDMVWTIQLRGLDRKARLVKNNNGVEEHLERTEEHQFG